MDKKNKNMLQKYGIPSTTKLFVRQKVSKENVCMVCLDMVQ